MNLALSRDVAWHRRLTDVIHGGMLPSVTANSALQTK